MTSLKRKRTPDDEDDGREDSNPPLPDEPSPESSETPPPLPDEPLPEEPSTIEAPPLPDEPVPSSEDEDQSTDEGSDSSTALENASNNEPDPWQAIWEPNANAYYFYNSQTKESTWLNPRLPPQEAEAYLAAHPPLIDPTAPPIIPQEPVPED